MYADVFFFFYYWALHVIQELVLQRISIVELVHMITIGVQDGAGECSPPPPHLEQDITIFR